MSSTIAVSNEVTIKNLQAAYNGESNAAHRYRLFADRAEEEGFLRAATLFRATARAEQIHAANHVRVLGRMGVTPLAKIEPTEVKSTSENLKAALAGEECERDAMYPEFIREAQSQNNAAAVNTFQLALDAEAVHARLYTEALNNLEAQRQKTTFYVCVVCGYTTDDANLVRCAICDAPREKFETIE